LYGEHDPFDVDIEMAVEMALGNRTERRPFGDGCIRKEDIDLTFFAVTVE
jgi:hypothetical protein